MGSFARTPILLIYLYYILMRKLCMHNIDLIVEGGSSTVTEFPKVKVKTSRPAANQATGKVWILVSLEDLEFVPYNFQASCINEVRMEGQLTILF